MVMDYFSIDVELRLLVCKVCKIGVIHQHALRHLRSSPHKLEKAKIQEAQAWLEGKDIIQNIEELKQLQYPSEYHPAIEALGPAMTDGLRCEDAKNCTYVAASRRRMFEHLQSIHKWSIPVKIKKADAKSGKETIMLWREGIRFQRLFNSGHCSGYFEVARRQEGGMAAPATSPAEAAFQGTALAFRERRKRILQQDSAAIGTQVDLGPTDQWVRRLGATSWPFDFVSNSTILASMASFCSPPLDVLGPLYRVSAP